MTLRSRPIGLAAALVAAALAAWIVTAQQMRGMDAGPGAELGALGWYVGVWLTMMAAMMLPSVAPMALVFNRVSGERARRGQAAFVPTWVFLAGYLLVWTAYGLAAFGVDRGVRAAGLGFLSWHRGGPIAAGVVVAVSGLYELTPLKRLCLDHCRSPLHFVLHDWREGRLGALRMGVRHGVLCVGCCWALMLVLFAVGVMSLSWMGVVAALIFAEKVLPLRRLPALVSVALVAVGVWIAVAPGSVPMLTKPGSAPVPMNGGSMSR